MTAIIIQARLGSTRLPRKVLKPILERPLIDFLIERLKQVKLVDQIIVATTSSKEDDVLYDILLKAGIDCFRGSEEDVLDRYYQTAKVFKVDTIIRITADCPLMDPAIVEKVISFYRSNQFDYVSNIHPPTYPDGLDVEIFSFLVLEKIWKKAAGREEREHVTLPIVRSGRYHLGNVSGETDYSSERWTVDYEEDYFLVKKIIEALYPDNPSFNMQDVLEYKASHPEVFKINQRFKRNEVLSEE